MENKEEINVLIDPIIHANAQTLAIITDTFKKHPSETVGAMTMCIVEMLDLAWYYSPPTALAGILSNLFYMLENKCKLHESQEDAATNNNEEKEDEK